MKTHNTTKMSTVIAKVFIKLENIICLTNDGDRWNDWVEHKRGEKHANIKFDFDVNVVKLEKLQLLLLSNDDTDNEIFETFKLTKILLTLFSNAYVAVFTISYALKW